MLIHISMRVVGDFLAAKPLAQPAPHLCGEHQQWQCVASKEATILEGQRLHKDFYFGVVLVKENQKYNNVKICIGATTIQKAQLKSDDNQW